MEKTLGIKRIYTVQPFVCEPFMQASRARLLVVMVIGAQVSLHLCRRLVLLLTGLRQKETPQAFGQIPHTSTP